MREPTCSDSSVAAHEPLAGSAPFAPAWLCLEQAGPWGRTALTTSHLDPDLGGRLQDSADAVGVRAALIRRPGRHADLHRGGRTVFAASTHPARTWLLRAEIDDPSILLDLDWAALARGDRDAVRTSLPALAPVTEPVLLVCTNGTRDTCCARLGRPVAVAAEADRPGRVWEVTHTSGHRFAPTSVLLPGGYLHGRLLDAATVLDAADRGELELTGVRGRTCWSPAGQVAEMTVRDLAEVRALDALTVEEAGSIWRVRHRDGRSWDVTVEQYDEGLSLDSCGKQPTPVRRWRTGVQESAPTG